MRDSQEPKIAKPVLGVAAGIAALIVAGFYYLHSRNVPPPAVITAPSSLGEHAEPPTIAHPLPDAADQSTTAAPLPALSGSDASVHDALGKLVGADAMSRYWLPEDIVRHVVVTIDNLPRRQVAVDKRPTVPLEGAFIADGDELHATIDRRNYERYKSWVAVISALDMQQLSGVYIHFYPLFQEAYQNLGYPTGYFNDRLVQVIDVMLAAPQGAGTAELVRPNVMYTFADPGLEARPAGQKLLIRMGPENAAVIKTKLMELRAIITAAPPRH